MDSREIGEKIRLERKDRKMTLQDIAENTGLARSTIQRYERGLIRSIKLPIIEAIARSISVNPSWLLGNSEQKEVFENTEAVLFQHGKFIAYDDLPEEAQKEIEHHVQYIRYKYLGKE